MTDSQLARRQSSAVRPFGSLPPAQTGLEIDRALELAGVDRVEFALLASTTFKEARSLEELVTLIATTRRRGLDGMLRHVYYEKFGGDSGPPSLHVAIDGLRGIAAATGEYAGSSEARYSGAWDMTIDEYGKQKQEVPERCTVTVWRLVKGRACAFEGVAWMSESYPGAGMRGRMWQKRPRGMLSIAAERQALRKAFPSETAGIGDHEDATDPDALPAPTTPTPTENAATYDKIFPRDADEPKPAKRERPLDDLIELYNARLKEAVHMRWVPQSNEWQLPDHPTREDVVRYGTELKRFIERAQRVDVETGEVLEDVDQDSPSAQEEPPDPPERPAAAADVTSPPPRARVETVTMRSALGQKLAQLVEDAARLEVPFDDCRIEFPAPREQVIRAIERLEDRVEAKKRKLAGLAEPVAAAPGLL